MDGQANWGGGWLDGWNTGNGVVTGVWELANKKGDHPSREGITRFWWQWQSVTLVGDEVNPIWAAEHE